MPCFAAVGAIKTEMDDNKWTAITIAYQMGFAYLVSFIFYQIGSYFYTRNFTLGTVLGILALVFFIYMVVRKQNVKREIEYSKSLA